MVPLERKRIDILWVLGSSPLIELPRNISNLGAEKEL